MKQLKADYFAKISHLVKHGTIPKGAKDGSVPTHSVVPVPPLSEADVLSQCLSWLRIRRVVCDRNNTGTGDLQGTGNIYRYGIKDAGDIMGVTPGGFHFEIECKRGAGGRLSAGQRKRMKKIRKSNGLYFVVHGVEELSHYLLEYL
jgi:hypothetical protein